jgi:hypothetical protein
MLDQLTIDRFEPHVGSIFRVHPDETAAVELRLDRVGAVMTSEAARLKRTAFSLYFSGPARPLLRQQTYRVEHPVFDGEAQIFIVPIQATANGTIYEAVFT